MPANTEKKIFISYRVKDTQSATGRLAEALKRNFDEDQIFMDIDKIEPGLEFSTVITKYLGSSDVMLAIIGPDWMGYNNETKTYRIHEKNDWVKTEIATALRRKIRVIPVLLDGGELPKEDLLPEELKPLLSRQSYEISNKRWQYDSEQLIGFLKKIIGPAPEITTTPPRRTNINWTVILGSLAVIAFFAIKMYLRSNKDVPETSVVVDSPSSGLRPIVRGVKTIPMSAVEQYVKVDTVYKNVAGKWYNAQKKVLYIISQNGKSLSVKAYNNALNLTENELGLLMGSGSGSINGQSVQFSLTIKNHRETFAYPLKATLTADEQALTGSAIFNQGGKVYYDRVQLQKQD